MKALPISDCQLPIGVTAKERPLNGRLNVGNNAVNTQQSNC